LSDLLATIREMRLARFTYAGGLVAGILAGYRLLSLRKDNLGAEEYERRVRAHHVRSAEAIYSGVLRLQGLMIKIGQTIGSRPDTFPHEYVRVLAKLQDRVPPRPWREIQHYIERQLGQQIDEVFSEFNPEPVAAASLAQVYRARLKDGREVAVKVVYPNIERLVETDLKILRLIMWVESRVYHFPMEPAFRELEANIPYEVDMVHEAHNMEAIAALLTHHPDVVIPGVIWEHTSERVLVMDYLDGVKVTDLHLADTIGADPKYLSRLTVEVYVELMLRFGHFHADPHPGNLFALPGNRLAIVDFGLTKRFAPQFLSAFKIMFRAMFTGDDDGVVQGMKAAGFELKNDAGDEGFRATGEFFRAMVDPRTYKDRELMDAANEAWLSALKPNPMVEMPGEIILAMRVFGLILGLGYTTGLEVDVARIILQYAQDPYVEPAAADGPLVSQPDQAAG